MCAFFHKETDISTEQDSFAGERSVDDDLCFDLITGEDRVESKSCYAILEDDKLLKIYFFKLALSFLILCFFFFS